MSKVLDAIAGNYEGMLENWKGLEQIVRSREIANLVSLCDARHVSAIEFGLGDGVFTEMLADHFDDLTAVDGSQTAINLVRSKLSKPNVTFEQSLIEQYTSTRKFDVVVMGHILEHVSDPVAVLEVVSKIMHRDSLLYISVPNCNSLHRLAAVKMGMLEFPWSLNDRDVELGHKIVFSPESFHAVVSTAGLMPIKSGGVMLKPLSNRQITEHWTPEMIAGFIELGDDFPDLCGDIYVIAKLSSNVASL